MKKLIDDLIQYKPVITDGSWGTQLQLAGLPVGDCPDIWNIINPGLVGKVAQSYVNAGSKIILTNTFRSSRVALKDFGYDNRVKEINKAGVEISKKAAGKEAFVFASAGPAGKLLLTGEITEEEIYQSYSEQVFAFKEAGADGIVIETQSDLSEALIALKAAGETGLPVVVSMVFDSGKDKEFTFMGNSPEECAKQLTDAGADIMGANCGQGIEGFVNICRRLKSSTDLPVWIKPNAGLPEFDGTRAVYKTTPEQFKKYVPELLNAGADFLGGCCGTSPEFIVALNKIIKEV